MKRDIISVLDMEDDLADIIDLSIKFKRQRYQDYEVIPLSFASWTTSIVSWNGTCSVRMYTSFMP